MFKRTDKYIALIACCLPLFSACSSDGSLSAPDSDQPGRTPIELAVGITGENPATLRAVSTSPLYGQEADAFSSTSTRLFMVMKSEEDGGSGVKYTRTVGTPADKVDGNKYNDVSFTGDYIRYWEDAHARKSQLSIYAACVPGSTETITIGGSSAYNSNTWSASATTTINWPLNSGAVGSQNEEFISKQDLCFSNNVSDGGTDNRIKFNEANKKFDRDKRLYFCHALTKITFKITKGDGFGSSFEFTESGKNVVLEGFNTSGTFDIAAGEFQASPETATINQLAEKTRTTGGDHELTGLLLPGTDLNSTTADAVHFTLEGNKYSLTKKQLMDAIGSQELTHDESTSALDNGKMRPGVEYIFTFTIGKTGISGLTASVVPWETVTATHEPSNARITISLLDGTHKTGEADFDLYRTAAVNEDAINDNYADYTKWTTGYTTDGNKATLTETSSGSGQYSTDWYWPDSKTFYHLRAVMPKERSVEADATNGDYITLTPGTTLTDVCWGAPFAALGSGGKLTYQLSENGKGFDGTGGADAHQIFKAIGATQSAINLELFHMMSDVTIKLNTTEGSDAVIIAGAKLELSYISQDGKVRMGNGLVVPSAEKQTLQHTPYEVGTPRRYYFVPQLLDNVVLTITTTDNNKYIVNMKDVKATTSGNTLMNCHTANSPITAWYPNHQYKYTFTLKKTGINVTATLAEWENVNANPQDVYIK